MKQYIQLIKQSKKIQLILFLGLIIQFIFSIVSVGFYHPDQHFQVLEFSSYQLHEPTGATSVWELASKLRPTLQVYFFSGYRIICEVISITNPFHQLTFLRVLQGISLFAIFNLLAFYYCSKKSHRVLIVTLLIINFSWFLPYSRTMFSSELVSALIFFPAIVFFQKKYLLNKATFYNSILIGFLLALSFFLRFQIAFAIAGFAMWIFFFEKQFKLSIYLLIGFAIGIGFNIFLDYNFYHSLVFTPYLYFKINILEGKAAAFGESGFTFYFGVLIDIVTVPFISLIILYHYLKSSFQNIKHPLIISTLFFFIGHFFIGHKEDRFMFTIINIIPIVIAINKDAFDFLLPTYKWQKIIKPIVIFSVVLNCILLVLFVFNPYSQTINFDDKLRNHFGLNKTKVFCYARNPLQTESFLPMVFYYGGMKNIEFINIHNIDSITKVNAGPVWLSSTFNDIKDKLYMVDSLGYKPQLYSSSMLWNINLFLHQKNVNTINDIWVLYKLEK